MLFSGTILSLMIDPSGNGTFRWSATETGRKHVNSAVLPVLRLKI
jgi:hypothetical protein